jgi:hypothetical protein
MVLLATEAKDSTTLPRFACWGNFPSTYLTDGNFKVINAVGLVPSQTTSVVYSDKKQCGQVWFCGQQ